MRVPRRSHPSGHGQDSFALHGDIRQRIGDQEARGTSFYTLFVNASVEFAFAPVVLENLYLFLPRRYVATPLEWLPYSRDYLESGISFIFDLAMQ